MADWSPSDYLKFADERSRPARDLIAQVPLVAPDVVYDLGCGPGNSTALLVSAYPSARIIGIDNSEAMLVAARQELPKVKFEKADLMTWLPGQKADLLFSNATFQWVPDHLMVLQRLMAQLNPGGVLAVQMPDNLGEPSHQTMRETAAEGPWAEKLKSAAAARSVLPQPEVYYEALKPLCSRMEIWHTVYNHPLNGVEGIVQLISSTGLRPFVEPLSAIEKEAFVVAYKQRLNKHYPVMADGKVLLRFPRLFIVAQKA